MSNEIRAYQWQNHNLHEYLAGQPNSENKRRVLIKLEVELYITLIAQKHIRGYIKLKQLTPTMPGSAATLAICLTPGRKPPNAPGRHEFFNSSNINLSKWSFTKKIPSTWLMLQNQSYHVSRKFLRFLKCLG